MKHFIFSFLFNIILIILKNMYYTFLHIHRIKCYFCKDLKECNLYAHVFTCNNLIKILYSHLSF